MSWTTEESVASTVVVRGKTSTVVPVPKTSDDVVESTLWITSLSENALVSVVPESQKSKSSSGNGKAALFEMGLKSAPRLAGSQSRGSCGTGP
jgi:hypothetical protein